jgi:Protein of unknown function (DUF3108)
VLLLAAAAAIFLHALLLGALPGLAGDSLGAAAEQPPARAPLTVRQMAWTRPAPATPAQAPTLTLTPQPALAAPAQRPPPRAEPKPDTRAPALLQPGPAAESAPPAPPADAVSDPPSEPRTQAEPAVETVVEAAAAAPTPPEAPAAEGAPAPLYRTQPAPPATLVFDLKRGLAAGQAVLQWRPNPDHTRYTLTLQAQAFGMAVAGWNSSGRFDAAGLAPERYAETRRSREVRATNFQREQGKLSFSALAQEFPLVGGLQDRSSWMLQLGAILQANPELALPGAQVHLVVVGTRGAPEPWVFTVMGRVDLLLPAAVAGSPVNNVVHLMREPRRPYDTRASVWLDPARHHLPIKVQLLVAATGEGQEFELRQLSLP